MKTTLNDFSRGPWHSELNSEANLQIMVTAYNSPQKFQLDFRNLLPAGGTSHANFTFPYYRCKNNTSTYVSREFTGNVSWRA